MSARSDGMRLYTSRPQDSNGSNRIVQGALAHYVTFVMKRCIHLRSEVGKCAILIIKSQNKTPYIGEIQCSQHRWSASREKGERQF